MNLSPEQKKILKKIQSKYEDEMVEAEYRALREAIDRAIESGMVSQSDFDNLMQLCGMDCHDYSDMYSYFD